MSFNHLVKIIGPAPNEVPRVELMQKLSSERDRVRRTIMWFREHNWKPKAPKTPKPKKTGGKPASKPQTLMKKAGVTLDQMKKAMEILKKQQEELINATKPND